MPFQLPPLSFNQSATSGVSSLGADFMAGSGPGDWNINLGGSGAANQGLSAGGLKPWMLLVAGLAALYLLKK